MRIKQLTDGVVVRAPAKVNLFLEVLAKRPDGYHEIATLMIAVSLHDRLRLTANSNQEIRLHCDDPRLATGPENLICRAAALLKDRFAIEQGAVIDLRKRIPIAAGLAGGSTDAAAALAGLNHIWQLGLSIEECMKLAGELGSDVPFFFATPAAWCTGRGECVEPIPSGRRLWFVLVCPSQPLATSKVYPRVRVPPKPLSGAEIRYAVDDGRELRALGELLHNRLQETAESLCPEIAVLRERLEQLQPLGVLVSGSGSTVFALCEGYEEAARIARAMRDGGEASHRVFLVRSCL